MYHPYIREQLAENRSRELESKAREHAAAERGASGREGWFARLAGTLGLGRAPRSVEAPRAEIRIRYASPADASRLRSLEERAGAPHLPAPVVVIDIDGSLLAAKSLRDGATVADPAHRGRGFEEVVALSVAGLGAAPRRS